jgi:glycosyltransferase involved in cell wall biosynthesis
MKISYAITVCNEIEEIKRLISFLLKHKRDKDEIVVQMDADASDLNGLDKLKKEVLGYIMSEQEAHRIRVIFHPLNNDFADFKNHLTNQCTGDYIFQIDADEIITEVLIENLPSIIDNNPDNEVYLISRVNRVEGLTEEYIKQWGWNVNENGWVNWPDYQWRIWKNKPEIKWVNKVHEKLDGFKTYALLGAHEELALHHPKTIEKQVKQNEFYEKL